MGGTEKPEFLGERGGFALFFCVGNAGEVWLRDGETGFDLGLFALGAALLGILSIGRD